MEINEEIEEILRIVVSKWLKQGSDYGSTE